MFKPNTTEKAQKALQDARTRLAEAVADPKQDSESLMSKLLTVAHYEGALRVQRNFDEAVANDATQEQALEEVMRAVLRGPDDTWSGRTNDIRRERWEGIRDTASELRWRILGR